jgi:hypothetical protein
MRAMGRLLHRSLLALLVFGCAAASAAQALEWRHVVSPAHGTEIAIPIDLVDQRRSDMVGGRLALKDGAILAMNLTELHGRSLDGFIMPNLPANFRITYRRRKGNWLAFSGYYRDSIIYGRTQASCGGRYAHSFMIRYPRADRGLYDRVVERMSLSFRVQPVFERTRCPER